tara:strand:- start:251 stop:565 length:315 start_codon:yes stop_codon:yes gene_type:complete
VKKYFYILLIEVSFGAIVIEPESQTQNSIYYDFLDKVFYYKTGDTNTSFYQDSLELRQLYIHFSRIREWPRDNVIQILHLHKNVVLNKIEKNKKIENYLLRKFK